MLYALILEVQYMFSGDTEGPPHFENVIFKFMSINKGLKKEAISENTCELI